MNEAAQKALDLVREIKSVVFATVDKGAPAARIIDVMMVKEDGLYFLTARGKGFYRELMETRMVAVCGMDKNYVTVRVVGEVDHLPAPEIID